MSVDLPSNAKGITKIPTSLDREISMDNEASVKTAITVLYYCRARDEESNHVFLEGL